MSTWIDVYDLANGWTRELDILPPDWTDLEVSLKEAGFGDFFQHIGPDSGTGSSIDIVLASGQRRHGPLGGISIGRHP